MYQRREQVALMALLKGKENTEAEAWAKLQKISLMSPWAGERALEEIENSWYKWESNGKQVRLGDGHRQLRGPQLSARALTLAPDSCR